jgi:predicted Zn-dependent protease
MIPGMRDNRTITNQIDAESLRGAVAWTERIVREFPRGSSEESLVAQFTPDALDYPKTHIWSEPTYDMQNDQRSIIANRLIASADAAGMVSAGYLSIAADGISLSTSNGRFFYAPRTLAECSLTVRDPDGTGSGWAGASSYDWNRFDVAKLAAIALDKCLRSRNPVAVEPGRYTTILEPQAVFDLLVQLFRSPFGYLERSTEESAPPSAMPFHVGVQSYPVSEWGPPARIGETRIGQRVLDNRITLSFDPLDPDLGTLPFASNGDPQVPLTWVKDGVLTTLAYDRFSGLHDFRDDPGKLGTGVFRMSGGTTSIDEMIATTKRGVIVTRFWDTEIIDVGSILCTGVTRDGLWLIENGKISHPIKNFRFTESPLFAFNQIDQLGVPVPVFTPGVPAVCPLVKVRDFSFTAMVDAV